MTIVEKDDRVQIERLELAPFGTNAYVIVCKKTGDSVLVDAPGEAARIGELLRATNPRYILITHNHIDHIGALTELKSNLNIPVAAHPLDAGSLPVPSEVPLNGGDTVSFGELELKVLHTPGHTAGSLCFLVNQYLIAGDTIFPGGPGRTNNPDALRQIIESITEKIFLLPDDIRVYPGHGESMILKQGKDEFAVFSSRPHAPGLCGEVLWLSS